MLKKISNFLVLQFFIMSFSYGRTVTDYEQNALETFKSLNKNNATVKINGEETDFSNMQSLDDLSVATKDGIKFEIKPNKNYPLFRYEIMTKDGENYSLVAKNGEGNSEVEVASTIFTIASINSSKAQKERAAKKLKENIINFESQVKAQGFAFVGNQLSRGIAQAEEGTVKVPGRLILCIGAVIVAILVVSAALFKKDVLKTEGQREFLGGAGLISAFAGYYGCIGF